MQFCGKGGFVLSGKARHKAHIHTGALGKGYRQRLACGVYAVNLDIGLNGALYEHIRLALQIAVVIQDFQRTEQRIAAVLGEGKIVAPAVQQAVFGSKIVIQAV